MAKFNKGKFGGIQYCVRPTGIRNLFNLYKIIPYILGYDVKVKLSIKSTDMGVWWSKCILSITSDRPGGVYEDGQSGNYDFPMTPIIDKKEWSRIIRLAHPLQPCTVSCKLSLEAPISLGKSNLPIVSAGERTIIEDLKIYSSHTIIGWGIGIFLTIALLVVGIWNLILLINQI